MNIEVIAKVCHQVNKAYCESQQDNSQKDWEDCPDWQIQSEINGVRFHIDNPDSGPEASHNNWLKQKKDEGWVYGPIKSESRKKHPCIVPFKILEPSQQAKDYIFKAIVDSLKHF